MASRIGRCCVRGCDSTTENFRLYYIPKNDRLRELWLQYLVRNDSSITSITKRRLLTMRVCEKHFEKEHLKPDGKRLFYGYPTLITESEIRHGVPLDRPRGNSTLFDHTYAKVQSFISATGSDVSHAPPTDSNVEETAPGDSDPAIFDPTCVCVQNIAPTTSAALDATPKESTVEEYFPVDILAVQPPRKIAKKTIKKTLDKKHEFLRKLRKEIPKDIHNKPFSVRYEKGKEFLKVHAVTLAKLNTYARNFIAMQLKLASVTKKEAHRYTLSEKMLALSLMKESPKGYRLLEKMFKLPSRRTLNRLAEYVTFDVGINKKIFDQLALKVKNWDNKKKLCAIAFDEVALVPHLTFMEKQDNIMGFVDTGTEKEKRFCDHALVFMVRGVVSSWRQVIGYYYCEKTISASDLKRLVRDVVHNVCNAGLEPIALICDQGSTFRSALKSLQQETRRQQLLNNKKPDDSIRLCEQTLFVVYDPPHLIKGIRNNLLNKKMIFNGKCVQWQDIIDIYMTDCQLSGDRMLPKLTEQHIMPDKIKKMKVSNCTKVLSARTAAVLEYTASFQTMVNGKAVSPTMKNTSEAVRFFDKLFDSVNGSRRGFVRGKLRGPVTQTSEHFKFWQEAIKILKNTKYLDETSREAKRADRPLLKTVPSLLSWITTLESMNKISELLFSRNIKYLYPRNLNQDPLENFFGRVRALNYRNTNPDPYTFSTTVKSLLITNMLGPHSNYSNCEADEGDCILNLQFLFEKNENIDKENIDPNTCSSSSTARVDETVCSAKEPLILQTLLEKVSVHSSAYTAGYICRKLTKRFQCSDCKKLYTSDNITEVHKWIRHREYKTLKGLNLSYPSPKFIILYRDCVKFIYSYLNKFSHKPNLMKQIKFILKKKYNTDWLGCNTHRTDLIDWFMSLLCRIHIHAWCNTINKILKGSCGEKEIVNKSSLHKMAFAHYKSRIGKKKNCSVKLLLHNLYIFYRFFFYDVLSKLSFSVLFNIDYALIKYIIEILEMILELSLLIEIYSFGSIYVDSTFLLNGWTNLSLALSIG